MLLLPFFTHGWIKRNGLFCSFSFLECYPNHKSEVYTIVTLSFTKVDQLNKCIDSSWQGCLNWGIRAYQSPIFWLMRKYLNQQCTNLQICKGNVRVDLHITYSYRENLEEISATTTVANKFVWEVPASLKSLWSHFCVGQTSQWELHSLN